MTAWADHKPDGSGKPLAVILRPGNTGSSTAADRKQATGLALAQLPRHLRRKVLVRADTAGGAHEFLGLLITRSRRLHYSAGITITEDIQDAILKVPASAWTQAYDGNGEARNGAWVAEITGMLDLSSWPAGMRVIVRKERPHPARSCVSPTSTATGSPSRRPARRSGSSRTWNCGTAAGTGSSAAPRTPACGTCHPKGFAQNQLWCEIVALACELLAWPQMIAMVGPARRWEPKRLRLRIFAVARRLVRGGRRLRLRLAGRWPWTPQITAAVNRLQALPSG
jgi:hypothetical protein